VGRSNLRKHHFGLLVLLIVAGHSNAAWTVTEPTSSDSFPNNDSITAKGAKTSGEMGNGWLKRETSPGNYDLVTPPNPINYTMPTTWTCVFLKPTNNWTNGNYRAYVKNGAGTSEDEGDTFTVTNP
jgi:hypothetical protein